jgi:phosphocarrier protein
MGIFSWKRDSEPMQHMAKELTIQNRLGLHARPSAMFVKVCSRFRCDVWVEKDGERVNGKSIMGLMMLAAGHGSKLQVVCEGPDCDRALQEIEALINGKFNEE